MRDWPILIFTILFSTAVGLTGFVALSGVLLQGELDAASQYAVLLSPMLLACVLGVVAIAASFVHLGNPLHALHVIRGVASSALSREIVMASAFVVAVGLTTLVALRSGRVSLAAVTGCLLIGICAIWFMGEVYRRTSVATWMHANTHVMFFGGSLVMGTMLGLALVGRAHILGLASVQTLFGWTVGLVFVGLVSQLAVMPSYVTAIDTNRMNAVVSYPMQPLEVFRTHAGIRCVRWIISLAGAATLLCALWRTVRSDELAGFGLTLVAGVLLFGGEILGRYVFYAIHD